MEVNASLWAAPLSIDHNGNKWTSKLSVMFCQPGSSPLNETQTAWKKNTCWLRELWLWLEWKKERKKEREDRVIPFNESDSKTRFNQLMSIKSYLACENWSLPWRIIELKKLKWNWCIDFFFSGMQNSQRKKRASGREYVAAVRE